MEKLPTLSVDLIKELDKAYPLRLPSTPKDYNNNDIIFLMGQRSIIDRLLFLQKADKEDGGLNNVL